MPATIVAVASDRGPIARDLHDTVIQRLYGTGMHLQAAMLNPGMTPDTKRRVMTSVDNLDQTIRELRATIFSLQADTIEPSSVRQAFLDVSTDAAAGLGFHPGLEFAGPVETISDVIAENLLPVLREALSTSCGMPEPAACASSSTSPTTTSA